MRIVVTGGTGFIGTHLARELLHQGHEVTTVSRRETGTVPGAHHHRAEVESPGALAVLPRGDAVVHLAGLADASVSSASPLAYNCINALGTLHALEVAREAGSTFILASSQRIYAARREPVSEDDDRLPVDPYGYSKMVAEKWVEMYRRLYGLRTVVVRFFSVYGPGQAVGVAGSGVVSIFVARAMAGQTLVVNNASLRDFTYVTDVVRGTLIALTSPAALGGIFNIATGKGTSLEQLALAVKEVTGSSSDVITRESGDDDSHVADIGRAQRVLGFLPDVDLWQGLELYARELARLR
ncbi:MAG: NAD-dependent epimerase/dehydratase family protein [Chloroflexi bacterium]|nr:NAD-dependent epimerase/dehydratase family protein [Chloroflexota bacterium]